MMAKATNKFLAEIDAYAEARKNEIRSTVDTISIAGTIYYVNTDGNDQNDGLSPESAWKTLARVSDAELCEGDGVLPQPRWCGYRIARVGTGRKGRRDHGYAAQGPEGDFCSTCEPARRANRQAD